MNGDYQFSEENADCVKHFLDLVEARPTSENKWNKFFCTLTERSRKSQQSEQISMLCTDCVSDDEALRLRRSLHLKDNSDDDAKITCDLLNASCQDESFLSTFEEMYMKSTKKVYMLPYLAEHLTEDAAKCFLDAALEKKENFQLIVRIYSDFLLRLMQLRPYARFLDDLLIHCYKSNPEQFYKLFLLLFLNDETISPDVFDHFAKSLDMDEKTCLLNEILALDLLDKPFLQHIPTVTYLYVCTHNEYINICMIKLLCRRAEIGRKDKNYGKLLLAVIQALESSCMELNILESLCLIHETVFKKACLNSLKRLRN